MNELNKMIGKRIKDRRKELNMTQKELAQLIGCAEITVRQYESGRNAPKIETRAALAKALDLPYGVLFDPDTADLVSMLPEVGVSVEGDPDPEKTQSDFDRARIDDVSYDLYRVLDKSGLVTYVPTTGKYYLRGKDLKVVELDDPECKSYLNRQLNNIYNYHYDNVEILRSMETSLNNVNEEAPPDDHQS